MFIAPPGMDPAILAQWQDIMEKTLTDPELIATATSAGRPIEYQNGKEIAPIIKDVMEHSEFLQAYLANALKLGQ